MNFKMCCACTWASLTAHTHTPYSGCICAYRQITCRDRCLYIIIITIWTTKRREMMAATLDSRSSNYEPISMPFTHVILITNIVIADLWMSWHVFEFDFYLSSFESMRRKVLHYIPFCLVLLPCSCHPYQMQIHNERSPSLWVDSIISGRSEGFSMTCFKCAPITWYSLISLVVVVILPNNNTMSGRNRHRDSDFVMRTNDKCSMMNAYLQIWTVGCRYNCALYGMPAMPTQRKSVFSYRMW